MRRRQAQIDEEAALDGLYVIRTDLHREELDSPAVVTAYKNLSRVERAASQTPSCTRRETTI